MTTKKRGRPQLDPDQRQDREVKVSLTTRAYADVCRSAAAERVSLSEYFRRAAQLGIKSPK